MIAGDRPDDPVVAVRRSLRPFAGQHPVQSVLVAAFAICVWAATFVAAVTMLGGESAALADTAAAVEARQVAGVFAGVGCGAYLGVESARERGGPVTNLLAAPVAAAVGVTGAPIAAHWGAAPAAVFSPASAGAVAVGGGLGTTVVLAAATGVTVAVVAIHLVVLAGPAQRRRAAARFAELPGVHLGPRPMDDWRRADGGADVEPGGAVEGTDRERGSDR